MAFIMSLDELNNPRCEAKEVQQVVNNSRFAMQYPSGAIVTHSAHP